MKLSIQLILLLFCFESIGQSKTDSLLQALKTAEGELKVKTYNELFKANINSNPLEAVEFARQALEMATEINDSKGLAAANNNLGVAYRNQGALANSLEYYLTALKIYETIGNKEGIASTQNNIGNIYAFKKDYEKALQYFQQSHLIFVETGDSIRIIGSLNNLGNVSSDLNMQEEALKYYNEAYDISTKLGKEFADPVSNMGNIYLKKGEYDNAARYYLKALEMARHENDQFEQLNIYSSIGKVYSLAGNYKTAQTYLDSALTMSRQMQAMVYQPSILKNIAFNYAKQGRMKEAFDMMVKYDETNEIISNEESTRKIAQMEMALDLQNKEKELDDVKAEKLIKELELKNTRMVITLVVLALAILVGGLNLFYSKRQAAQLKKSALKKNS
jgi:tetratricopeptide (TPR) repeat protein